MSARTEVRIDGGTLAWQQLGAGPDAVLLHGLAASRAFWYPNLAQTLQATRQVTLYDLRGHGYSARPPHGYSCVEQAADLLALMDALAIDRADLVGHSYGGAIALEFALRHPQRTRSLVLMDIRVGALQPEQRLRDGPPLSALEREIATADGRDWEREKQVGFAFLEAMARLHLDGFRARAREAFTPFAEGGGGERTARRYVELLEQTTLGRDVLAPGADAGQIAKLSVPTLLMYGDASRCLASGEALARLLPQAQMLQLRDAGHFFPVTHADAVAEAVTGFLAHPEAPARRAA